MPKGSPFRAIAAVAVAGVLLAGCGRESAAPLARVRSPAPRDEALAPPRPIELPAELRPIASDSCAPHGESARPSIAATFERGNEPVNHSPPRIVELSAPSRSFEPDVIREPLGGSLAMTTVEPPPRLAAAPVQNPFVAENSHSETPAPSDPPLPVLSPQPQFASLPQLEQAAPPAANGIDQQGPYGGPPPAVAASSNQPPDRWNVAARSIYGPLDAQPQPQPQPQPQQPVAIPPPVAAPTPAVARPAAIPAQRPPEQAALMQPVVEQALQISNRGFAMAQRGMFYTARAELIQALQLLAQAHDVQHGTSHHGQALASGLMALEEARDFQSPPGQPAVVDARQVAGGHRTQVLQHLPGAVSPVVAQQQYFAHAQAQLAAAVGGERVASQTLYRLGKLETALAAHDDDRQAAHGPQAMVFHQAALSVDAANYLAANELGVLLARYGQLAEARRLLVHSVSLRPHAEGWHNLAVVHRRLGEDELAKRAEHERTLLAKKEGDAGRSAELPVRWVDRQTFAASGPRDIPWPEHAAPRPTASSPPAQRR
jgi:Flp pilus assembly protein TadD